MHACVHCKFKRAVICVSVNVVYTMHVQYNIFLTMVISVIHMQTHRKLGCLLAIMEHYSIIWRKEPLSPCLIRQIALSRKHSDDTLHCSGRRLAWSWLRTTSAYMHAFMRVTCTALNNSVYREMVGERIYLYYVLIHELNLLTGKNKSALHISIY